MTIAPLVLSFLLSLMPLIIGTMALRFRTNLFSQGVLALSSLGFLLGVAQAALLGGLSFRLFSAARYPTALAAYQWVSIAGATVMILAGLCWIGYFRQLLRTKASSPKPKVTPAPTRPKKVAPSEELDWFAKDFGEKAVVRLAAKTSIKPAKRKMPVKRKSSSSAPKSESGL